MLGNREDSEDVLQEALLSGFRNIGQFQCRSKFSTWMHAILRNSARTMWREQRCRPIGFSVDLESFEDDHLHFADGFVGSSLDPEEEYFRGENSRIVAELLAELPPKYREVVWLCKIEEWKLTDVAEKLGVQVGTVKARMHRARRMIEKHVNAGKVPKPMQLPMTSDAETVSPSTVSRSRLDRDGRPTAVRPRRRRSRRVRNSARGLTSSGRRFARNLYSHYPP
jgi:RNA polymerase sigma-70 factor (ECF subfamily)